MTEMIYWKGNPITKLTPDEQRQALADAIAEINFPTSGAPPDEIFALILLAFVAGVITALACVGLPFLTD